MIIYQAKTNIMRVLGLTGGIATGKSTVARMFRYYQIPIFDADACVHQLMKPEGKAFEKVARTFPEAKDKEGINRQKLGRIVFEDEQAKTRLEAIIHPMVREEKQAFLATNRLKRQRQVLLDIPLLFETGAEQQCHAVIVTSCPGFLQKQRVMRRLGMTEEKFSAIRAQQMPEAEKIARADYVIPTGLGYNHSMRYVQSIIKEKKDA